MPTLAVGMLQTRENHHMPTASVGMAPVSTTFRNGYAAFGSAVRAGAAAFCQP